MASKYKILDIKELSKILMVDVTQFKDNEDNRVYHDPWIEKQITKAEILVFGTMKKKYKLETDLISSYENIPDNVLSAVEDVAELRMRNQMIKDQLEVGEIYDVKAYYKEMIEPLIAPQTREGELISITPVDDYNMY